LIKDSFYLGPDGRLEQQLSLTRIEECLAAGEGLLWVDIEYATEEDGRFMASAFHFHQLAIADCVSKNIHSPKIDEFEDHLFIIIHGINYHSESDVLETTELGLFLGKNYVVTSHDVPMTSISATAERICATGRPMQRGVDFLAHDIIDSAIDFFMPVIDIMQERCSEMEIEAIHYPSKDTITSIINLKRSVMSLNRVMIPQRELLNSLSRGDYPFIGERALMYYRNVYDHIVRIEMLCQEIRDLVDNILSTYLSSVANRQNETMKLLAIVASIFLPLSLLAGIYGMNFENMPELKWRWGYFAVVGIIGMAILIMLWFFWARNWISIGRHRVTRLKPFVVDPLRVKNYVDKLVYLDGMEHAFRRERLGKKEPKDESPPGG